MQWEFTTKCRKCGEYQLSSNQKLYCNCGKKLSSNDIQIQIIGFIDDPQIYSDIFVERGKLGVLENNLRLCEITSTGELDVYGGGFFKINKQ